MATVTNYPIDLPILVIEAQIFVAVNKFQFLPNKLIPSDQHHKVYHPKQLCVKLSQDEGPSGRCVIR